MRIHRLMALLGLALVVAGPALAADSAGAQTPKQNPNAMICKSLPPATGTRIGGRRICKTQAQWDRDRQRAQDSLSKTQVQRGTERRSN